MHKNDSPKMFLKCVDELEVTDHHDSLEYHKLFLLLPEHCFNYVKNQVKFYPVSNPWISLGTNPQVCSSIVGDYGENRKLTL